MKGHLTFLLFLAVIVAATAPVAIETETFEGGGVISCGQIQRQGEASPYGSRGWVAYGDGGPCGTSGYGKVQEFRGDCLLYWINPLGILDRRVYAAGKDYALRELEGEDGANREQLDLNHQRPLDAVQVYEIEKPQRFKESHYCYCKETHYKAPKNALG